MATTFFKFKPSFVLRSEDKFVMSDPEILLTSFFGGMNNGRSLQLSIFSNNLHSSKPKVSMLTRTDVTKLRNELNRWLDNDVLTEVD